MTGTQVKEERLRRRSAQHLARFASAQEVAMGGEARSAPAVLPQLPQLPQGWERRLDDQGRVYYIDWNTRR